MSAWIYVFNHPYYTVTDETGSFRLPPVPPGRYTLSVRHPEGGMDRRQEIIVRPAAPVQLRIEFGEKDLKVEATAKPTR
jgi:Carboxypeptidase regulatory-like domain